MARSRAGLALAVVLALLAAAPAQATFPGRNGVIAYAQNGSSGDHPPVNGSHALEAIAPRWPAGEPRTLLSCEFLDYVAQDCAVEIYASPSYSANGRRIVFDAGPQIGIVNANGTGLRLLTPVTANDGDPAFSPDGRRIVFTGDNERGTTDVYVRSLDGGAPKAVFLDAQEPAWSSRNEIAYVREGNIYAADPNGRHRRFVTSGVAPDWSPDGRRLLLVRPAPNFTFASHLGRLHVVGARGRGLHALGKRKDVGSPVWSPDGRWLAFHGFDLGVHKRRFLPHARIFELAPTQIGDEGAYVTSYDPAWQPR